MVERRTLQNNVEEAVFDDGSWWRYRTLVTRGMRKAFHEAGFKAVARSLLHNGNANVEDLDLSDAKSITQRAISHPELLDLDAIDDAYLLHGTVAWSWDEPITLENLDKRADIHASAVLAQMKLLYAEVTAEAQKK